MSSAWDWPLEDRIYGGSVIDIRMREDDGVLFLAAPAVASAAVNPVNDVIIRKSFPESWIWQAYSNERLVRLRLRSRSALG